MQNPFAALDERLSNIEEYLLKLSESLQYTLTGLQESSKVNSETDLLNTTQASSFLGIATQTLYINISKIPHIKRHNRLYFRKADLMEYMEAGRVKGGRQ